MPETPEPYVPQRVQPKARIKPAGWVVIVLALGAGGYFGWTKVVQPLLASRGNPETPENPVVPAPPTPAKPAEGLVLSRELFPSVAATLPEVKAGTPVAKVALPAFVGIDVPASGASPASSEMEAIRAVMRGDVDAAIVSVAAFAAVPDAPAAGVKAAWLVGTSVQDGGLFPSCDAATLRKTKLGVVPTSLAHFHLLAALAGEPLPSVMAYERDSELERAINDKVVTGGAARGRALKFLAASGKPTCAVLPESAFSLVIVRNVNKPMTAPELAAIAALSRKTSPSPEEVAVFFDRKRRAPGSFAELYDSAADVWSAVGLVGKPASSKSAVDRTFLDGGGGAKAGEKRRHALTAAKKELGFPSWLDR